MNRGLKASRQSSCHLGQLRVNRGEIENSPLERKGKKKVWTNAYTSSMVYPSLCACVQPYNRSNVGEDDPLKIVVREGWNEKSATLGS